MKLKSILYRFSTNVLIIISMLGMVIVYSQLSGMTKSFNFWIFLFGIALLLPIIVKLIVDNMRNKKQTELHNLELESFKKSAKKITVNLENVEIISNRWNETKIVNSSRYAAYDELMGDGNRNLENVEISRNLVTLKIPYGNSEIKHQFMTSMEENKLRIHFALKKETAFYIDSKDKSKNYLDLEFLKGN